MKRTIRSFIRNRCGSIAVTSAIMSTVLIGLAAVGVDLGTIYTDRRKAQSTADLAAIAAVSDLANADKAAAATVARNRLPDATYTVQYGIYVPDPAVKPDKRFTPSSSADANAARVTVNTTTPLFFGRLLTGKDSFAVNATATATQSSLATFSIGSRLLSINGGMLNQILGGLLGSSLSLSVMDYQALIDTKLDLFGFMNALASRLQITGVTYDTVLQSNVKVGDIINAMVDTGRQQYGSLNTAVKAMATIAQAAQGSMDKMKVSELIDLGPYNSVAVGQTPKVGLSLAAFDMVSAAAQIANDDHQIELALNAAIPGIAAASLKVAIGERPKGTSWVAVGGVGASVHTAQTRVLLTVQLAGTAPYSIVTLPIYIEIASGTAKLTSLTCGFPDIATSSVTLGVTPGVIDAWIGDVSSSQFTNFTSSPNPPAATLVNLAVLKVTGRAHVSIGNMSPTPLNFYYSDIQQQTKKTVGTTNFTASLLSRLVGDTQLGVNVLGLGLGVPVVTSGIAAVLANAVSPLDQLLSQTLQTLGVGLGQADVWVPGIRCDGAVLVI